MKILELQEHLMPSPSAPHFITPTDSGGLAVAFYVPTATQIDTPEAGVK